MPSIEVVMRDSYNKSLGIIQSAMQNVKQELIIRIGDKNHIVYITDIVIGIDGAVSISYNTLEESMRDELYPHIEKCVKIQIDEIIRNMKDSNSVFDYMY